MPRVFSKPLGRGSPAQSPDLTSPRLLDALAWREHYAPRETKPEVEDRVNVERWRIRMLVGAAALGLTLTIGSRSHAGSEPLPGMTVYKTPT